MKTISKTQYSSQRIGLLSQDIQSRLNDSIQEIQVVNDDIHVLSINAKIQAARAGHAGAGFSVVASEVSKLVTRTQSITSTLRDGIENTLEQLVSLNQAVRGDRISQAAASAIDIVDRNLYERSCDVRWWATENAVISALNNPTPENLQYKNLKWFQISG
jgi:methyl-accepting chemotaxis protein